MVPGLISEDMATTRVLIVDDIPRVREDLRMLLTLVGDIEIVGEAANGLEAVHQLEVLRPEAILMDLVMPVMDGYAATQRVKALDPACRVIALTVHGYESACQKAMQAGVDAFVVKGAPLDTLLQAIGLQKGL